MPSTPFLMLSETMQQLRDKSNMPSFNEYLRQWRMFHIPILILSQDNKKGSTLARLAFLKNTGIPKVELL